MNTYLWEIVNQFLSSFFQVGTHIFFPSWIKHLTRVDNINGRLILQALRIRKISLFFVSNTHGTTLTQINKWMNKILQFNVFVTFQHWYFYWMDFSQNYKQNVLYWKSNSLLFIYNYLVPHVNLWMYLYTHIYILRQHNFICVMYIYIYIYVSTFFPQHTISSTHARSNERTR